MPETDKFVSVSLLMVVTAIPHCKMMAIASDHINGSTLYSFAGLYHVFYVYATHVIISCPYVLLSNSYVSSNAQLPTLYLISNDWNMICFALNSLQCSKVLFIIIFCLNIISLCPYHLILKQFEVIINIMIHQKMIASFVNSKIESQCNVKDIQISQVFQGLWIGEWQTYPYAHIALRRGRHEAEGFALSPLAQIY